MAGFLAVSFGSCLFVFVIFPSISRCTLFGFFSRPAMVEYSSEMYTNYDTILFVSQNFCVHLLRAEGCHFMFLSRDVLSFLRQRGRIFLEIKR